MKIQPSFTGAILASLALVLVIGLIEINELDYSEFAVHAVPGAVDAVTVDSPVVTQEQPDCMRAESEFSAILDESRSCTIDADCTLANFGCPFECVASVGKSLLGELQREERLFQQACHRCVSVCPEVPGKWRAACVRQRCIALDRSIDELQEETLRLIDESS